MIPAFLAFINQILIYGGFQVSRFPAKLYQELVTALGLLAEQGIVLLPGIINLISLMPGMLIIDDTSNPKYGLKHISLGLFKPSTKEYRQGYKILLFLWVSGSFRIPIGFALCYKTSPSPADYALRGWGILRNHYCLKPELTLADGGFSTTDGEKRLDDYDWPFIMRERCDRNVDGKTLYRQIPRGYGEITGKIVNGTKLKFIRSKSHFLVCNRVSWARKKIQALYRLRWKIEEIFRVLKSCIGLGGCHQHSMRAQAIYVLLCLMLFYCLETFPGQTPYQTFSDLISGTLRPQDILNPFLIRQC
jgi:hypothetical protein